MKNIRKLLTAVALSGTMLCNFMPYVEAVEIADDGYVEAEGFGEPGQSVGNGRRSAIMDAYRYLAEQIDDLHISSSTTVRQSRTVNDEINSNIDSIIHGAKVISVTKNPDGSFQAKVRLAAYGDGKSIAAAVLPIKHEIKNFPKPKYTITESSSTENVHCTGLIIDCRGLNLTTAVAPSIRSSDGVEIYSYSNLKYEQATKQGVALYSHNMNNNEARVGNSPLIVKAVSIYGKCDPVVSQEDADKILTANQSTGFLSNCKVVLVR